MNSWQAPDDQTDAFLREFERRNQQSDEQAGNQYADTFLVADPQRALAVSRDAFVYNLPMRRKLFADAGVGPPELIDAQQLDLDPIHRLISTRWRAPRSDHTHLILESTFLVRRTTPLQILVYLNHKDLAALLGR